MSLSWKKCFLNVPLNEEGIKEHDNFDEDMKNIFTIELSEEEYGMLSDVFYEFNQNFNIIIDIFEEETLEPHNIDTAIKIAKKHLSNDKNSAFNISCEKLLNALLKAKELDKPVYFDF